MTTSQLGFTIQYQRRTYSARAAIPMPGETTGTDIFSIAQGQSTLVEKAIPHDLTISSTARLVRNCDATGLLDVFRSLVREKGERASLNKGRGRGDLKVTIPTKADQHLVRENASKTLTQGHRE